MSILTDRYWWYIVCLCINYCFCSRTKFALFHWETAFYFSSVDSAPKTDIGEEYNSASGSASDVEQEDTSPSTDHEEMFEKEHARRRRYLPARENVASRSELDSFMRNAGSSERDDRKFCDQGKKRAGTKNRGKRQVYDNISLVISKKNYILSDIVFDIIETSVRKIRIHLDRLPTYTGLYRYTVKLVEYFNTSSNLWIHTNLHVFIFSFCLARKRK